MVGTGLGEDHQGLSPVVPLAPTAACPAFQLVSANTPGTLGGDPSARAHVEMPLCKPFMCYEDVSLLLTPLGVGEERRPFANPSDSSSGGILGTAAEGRLWRRKRGSRQGPGQEPTASCAPPSQACPPQAVGRRARCRKARSPRACRADLSTGLEHNPLLGKLERRGKGESLEDPGPSDDVCCCCCISTDSKSGDISGQGGGSWTFVHK